MLQRKEESIAQLNKTKILAAAEKEFALNGFEGTRVQKIADRAGLPKTNVLYYFKTKQTLYIALLEQIIQLWNGQFDNATIDDDPAVVLSHYIVDKMEISRRRPDASKVFALEIINRAPNLSEFFKREHSSWMKGRVAVINGWIKQGKITAQDPYALLFHIWAMTQHYADFSTQINELRGKKMTKGDFENATQSDFLGVSGMWSHTTREVTTKVTSIAPIRLDHPCIKTGVLVNTSTNLYAIKTA